MKKILSIGIGVLVLLTILFNVFYTIDLVDSAEIGIMVNRTGENRGVSDVEIKSGWVIYNHWTKELHTYPSFAQIVDYEPFDIQDKKGTIFHADPTIEYYVNREDAPKVFISYRTTLSELNYTMILTEVKNAYKDISGLYETDSIINNRPQFEEEVKQLLATRLTNKGITLNDVQSSVKPNQEMQKVIDNKNASVQRSLQAQNELVQAKAEAEKLVTKAKGEAEANRIVANSITPTLMQWKMIDKWNGIAPQVMGGNVMPTFSLK